MSPKLINKICAHPVIICWIIGAIIVDTLLVGFFFRDVSLSIDSADWRTLIWLLVALVPCSALGLYAGIFTTWPFVSKVCSKVNGAPLRQGDYVIVLSGKGKGKTAPICEIVVGQGGWELARLSLQSDCTDIYEQYRLFKIKKGSGQNLEGVSP